MWTVALFQNSLRLTYNVSGEYRGTKWGVVMDILVNIHDLWYTTFHSLMLSLFCGDHKGHIWGVALQILMKNLILLSTTPHTKIHCNDMKKITTAISKSLTMDYMDTII